jgi:hypothetical protein
MDEVVRAALARWPDVPDVFGWLALDARGRWRVKGERITHAGVTEFIGRNYACDARGRWFFQNGPQRVFVTLEVAPWVVHRTHADARVDALARDACDGDVGPTRSAPPTPWLVTHTGAAVTAIDSCWLTDDALLLLGTASGLACVDDRDLAGWLARIRTRATPHRTMDDATLDAWTHGDDDDRWEVVLPDGARPLQRVTRAQLPRRFGFDPRPVPAPGQAEC